MLLISLRATSVSSRSFSTQNPPAAIPWGSDSPSRTTSLQAITKWARLMANGLACDVKRHRAPTAARRRSDDAQRRTQKTPVDYRLGWIFERRPAARPGSRRSPPNRARPAGCCTSEGLRHEDRAFADLPALLRAGDLIVFNDTRVIKARVFARKAHRRQGRDAGRSASSRTTRLGAAAREPSAPKPGAVLRLPAGARALA